MGLKQPDSMDDLVYFTRRKLGEHGSAIAWVYKGDCPKCKKAKMGKPRDPKTKKVKVRSKEYVCPACNHVEEKEPYEETLTCECSYTCPHCKKQGESTAPFKRKSTRIFDEEKQKKVAVKVIRMACEHCSGNIDITQKMK